MSSINVNDYLPEILQNDLWEQFNEAVSEELTLLLEEIVKDKNFYDIENQTDEDIINSVAQFLGYTPTREIDESIEFLRKEVMLIAFNLFKKTSLGAHQNIFNTINKVGKVYNLLWNGTKLIRQIDVLKTLDNITGYDYNYHFKNTEPLYYFPDDFFKQIRLDEGYTLDDDNNPAILDFETEKILSKHYEINYIADVLITKNSIEYLITEEYLSYLDYKTIYHKKAVEVPHVGIQLNLITNSSGSFNDLGGDEDYTYPEIKTSCSVTQSFIKIFSREPILLDDGHNLDSLPEIYLDNETITEVPLDPKLSFQKVVAGIGKRNLINKENNNLLKDLNGYWTFDDLTTGATSFIDYSGKNYIGSINGDFTIVRGIFGKGSFFSGNSGCYCQVDNVSFLDAGISFYFWLNKESNNNVITFIECVGVTYTIKISYNETTEEITLTPFDSLLNDTFSYTLLDDTDYFISGQIDRDNNTFILKINDVEVSNVDITTVGDYSGDYTFYFASDNSGTSENLKGYLDEIKFYEKLISDSEMTYVYSNLISNSSELDYLVYEDTLDLLEINEIDEGYFIQGYIKGQIIKDEKILQSNGSQTSISGTLLFSNITPNTVKIYFTNLNNIFYIANDNGFGLFEDDYFSGTIDYETGDYVFNFYKDTEIVDIVIHEGSTTTVAYTVDPEVLENTLEVTYVIGSTTLIATDDGAGNITGTSISSGTVNYLTGAIEITFSVATDVGTDVLASYTKRVFTIPDNEIFVYAEYGLEDKLELTELGLKNNENQITAIANFPPIEFIDNKNHLGFTFLIYK